MYHSGCVYCESDCCVLLDEITQFKQSAFKSILNYKKIAFWASTQRKSGALAESP